MNGARATFFRTAAPRRAALRMLPLAILLIPAFPAPASIPEHPERWASHYDDGRRFPDYGERIVLSPDGSKAFVSGRSVLGYDSLGRPIYIPITVAYDTATGEREWVRYVGGFIAVSPDGARAYLASGSAVTALSAGSGALLWTALFEDPTAQHQNFDARSITAGPDGTSVYVTGPSDLEHYATVAYAAETGARRWMSFLEGATALPLTSLVTVSPDGARVFVTARGGHLGDAGPDGSNTLDYLIAAYDATTGAEQWVSSYDSGSADYASALTVAPDGSQLYVTGWSQTTSGDDEPAYALGTVAVEASSGIDAWSAQHDETTEIRHYTPAIATGGSGGTLFVAGPVGSDREGTTAFGLIAYDTEKDGARRWFLRYDPTEMALDVPTGIAVSPDGAAVYLSGRTYQGSVQPATTVSVDAGTGQRRWTARYAGDQGRGAYADAIAMSPDGATVYVTGAVYLYPADYDMLTIAYRSSTCEDGPNENGPLSGSVHERVEALAGPARPLVHGISCDVMIPLEHP